MTSLDKFVESRLPMVLHALGDSGLPEHLSVKDFRGLSRYSVQQAFFYQLDWYVDERVLLSETAWAYVEYRYGENAGRFWTTRRHAFSEFETALSRDQRTGFSKLGILYEHVFTGTMFWDALEAMYRAGKLDTKNVVDLIIRNYRTAWIGRGEVEALPQSRLGTTLLEAWRHFDRAGIKLMTSPSERFVYSDGGASVVATSAARVTVECVQRLVVSSMGTNCPLTQVGGPSDPGTRQRGALTPGFLPSSWLSVRRFAGPHGAEQWKSGLPLVFWLDRTEQGFAVIAEVGPWHDTAQRKRLGALLRDVAAWTKNSDGGGVYWRYWRCNAAPAEPHDALADIWEELAQILPEIEGALEEAGLLPSGT